MKPNVFFAWALALAVLAATAASAENYPSRPIRIIVPSSPGGGSDILARLLGQKLGVALNASVVVENRAGGGGRIGTMLVGRSTPDGYTLLMADLSHVVNPALDKELPYDPIKDFAPIMQVTRQAYVLVVQPSLPAQTIAEFVALAKSRARNIPYASSGIGAAAHLAMEEFKFVAGFDAVHVPFQGTNPAMVAVLAKNVDCTFSALPVALPFLKSGQLRALGVTGRKRAATLPDVPTIAESGYPGFAVEGWKGLFAPAGTPPEILTKLHDAFVKILAMPEIQQTLALDGSEPVGSTPAEYLDYLKAESAKWATVVKQAGIKTN